jgi:hypothetical protein
VGVGDWLSDVDRVKPPSSRATVNLWCPYRTMEYNSTREKSSQECESPYSRVVLEFLFLVWDQRRIRRQTNRPCPVRLSLLSVAKKQVRSKSLFKVQTRSRSDLPCVRPFGKLVVRFWSPFRDAPSSPLSPSPSARPLFSASEHDTSKSLSHCERDKRNFCDVVLGC